MRLVLLKQLFIAVLFMGTYYVNAQCPAGGITFLTQEQIDSFNVDYPDCTEIIGKLNIGSSSNNITNLNGLANIVSVGGIRIQGTHVTNLEGLNNLEIINGQLEIMANPELSNLAALNNIHVATRLNVSDNNSLTSLSGLENLELITGGVQIIQNNLLPNLTGLEGLENITGLIEVRGNSILTTLVGIENLHTTGGISITFNPSLLNINSLIGVTSFTVGSLSGLKITSNASLTNLEGLINLTNISNRPLEVSTNASLTSLEGIDNIDPNSISLLKLLSSNQLSTCNVPSICEYLNAGKPATISGNTIGCNSVPEVIDFCEGFSDCPENNVVLETQYEVDSFLVQYPECSTILGDLYIGLAVGTSNITSLSGLQNIINVTGKLTISNTSLTDLNGINNLSQLGGDLSILNNSGLQDIEDLTSLININSSAIIIENNDVLSGLSGLNNINPESISNLILQSSQNLSTCDVESICTYISTINSSYTISGNATGCNSFEEVLEACQDILPLCPPANVMLVSQAEIDHFAIQYPNCTQINGKLQIGHFSNGSSLTINNLNGLSNIETVNNSLLIYETSLTNLEGLNNLTQISALSILYNDELLNLEGLTGLTSIPNNLTIMDNKAFINFEGLNNLTQVGDFGIQNNESLISFAGLNSLTQVGNGGGEFGIFNNISLETFEGLNNLTGITGPFKVNRCPISNFEGLDNLETISGYLKVWENDNLINFEGLDNLTGSLAGLLISDNPSLVNFTGMNHIVSSTSANIDNNSNLQNFDGLNNVQSLGNLAINNNDSLTTLFGLNNLNNISLDLVIQNNSQLTSLESLSNLTTIVAGIILNNNSSLSSLNGLDNVINFSGLTLTDSPLLSICNVESICNYLSGGGNSTISGNAVGCSSAEEILDLCALGIEEFIDTEQITLYPVPTKQILNIQPISNSNIELVRLFDFTGKEVYSIKGNQSDIDISALPAGTYLVSVKTSKGIHNQKIIKK